MLISVICDIPKLYPALLSLCSVGAMCYFIRTFLPVGSLFYQRPARCNLCLHYARLIAKKLTDSKNYFTNIFLPLMMFMPGAVISFSSRPVRS